MTRPYKLEIASNRLGVCHLRIRSPNGEIIFSGEQMYSETNAKRAARRFDEHARIQGFQITEAFDGPPAEKEKS